MSALILALMGVALAQEPANAAPADAAPADAAPTQAAPAAVRHDGWRELYVAVRDLQERVGSPIVLAAAGPNARATGRKVESLFRDGEVVLRPVPTVGDPAAELSLAQQATGLSCVAWLREVDAAWQLEALGDCGPSSRPAQADQPPPPPPLLRQVPRRGVPDWAIVDDRGHELDTWRYATLTRDDDLRDRLISERRRRRVGARVLEIGGIVLASAAVLPLAASFGAEPEIAEDRRFTAAFMVSSGAVLFIGGRLDRRGLDARQAEVGHYVNKGDAFQAIDDWNQRSLRLRAEAAAVQSARIGEEAVEDEPEPQPEPTPAAEPAP